MDSSKKKTSPWLYVTTLYFPVGLMTGLVGHFPSNFLKILGYSNHEVGILFGVRIIESFSFLYAPWIDGLTSKRRLVLVMQILTSLVMLITAVFIYIQPGRMVFFWGTIVCLSCVAITSGAHRTGSDGYFIRVFDAKMQAQFTGVKTAMGRIGMMFAVIGLLWMANKIAACYGAIGIESEDKSGFHIGFSITYACSGIMMLLFAICTKYKTPIIPQDQKVWHASFPLGEVLREYFSQRRVVVVLLFILLYRFGQGLIMMRNPFLLDSLDEGGLAVKASTIPFYVGLATIPQSILGGILGGYIIKWFGIRKTLVPLALWMSLPKLFYVWIAWARPESSVTFLGEELNIAVLWVSSLESLGYGLGFSALMYYLQIMSTEAGKNKTSILAFSTAVMNFGFVFPSMLSGYVQMAVGYTSMFLLSMILGFLVLLTIPFLPMPLSESVPKTIVTKKG